MLADIKIKDILFYVTILLLWFTAFAHYRGESMEHLALYAVTPVVAMLALTLRLTFRVGRWFGWLIVLYVWVGLMALFAYDKQIAANEMHRILGCILFAFIVASLVQNSKYTVWVYGLYIVLLICAILYARREILPYVGFGEGRIMDENLNANTLAYYTFFYAITTFLLGQICQMEFWKRCWRVLFFTTIPVVYGVAIATASRQVLIICAPMVVLLLVYRYLISHQTPKWQKWLAVSVILIAMVYMVPTALDMYRNSELRARNEMSVLEDERVVLLREAVQVGCNHPLCGVGPGNFRVFSSPGLFSHCTYTELFANTGIIGALIYILVVGAFCWISWTRWRQTKDAVCFGFLIFGCFYAIYQFFYVFYADNWLISFFVLVATHSDVYYKECYANTTDTHGA